LPKQRTTRITRVSIHIDFTKATNNSQSSDDGNQQDNRQSINVNYIGMMWWQAASWNDGTKEIMKQERVPSKEQGPHAPLTR
jgi:hypothetical protein